MRCLRRSSSKEKGKIKNQKRTITSPFFFSLQLFETPGVREHFARQPPHLLGGVLQGAGRLAFEQVQVGEEVVRTALALQTRDQLEEDAVDPVGDARLVPLRFARVFFALVQEQGFHVVAGDGVAGQVQVSVSERLQDAETALPAAALQESVFRLEEREDPSVALHRRLFALQGDALFGEEVETLGLHLDDVVGVRPGDLGERPVRRRSGPQAGALEGGRDLDDEALADAEFHFGGVGDHLDRVSVGALITGLSHQGLEPGAHLPRREVAGGGDELDPQGHGALAAVAQLEDGAAGEGAVVDEIQDPHLVEVDDHFELDGRDDLESVVAAVVVGQRGDEARLLDFDFFEDVLDDAAHLLYRLADLQLPRLDLLRVVLVQLVDHLGLCRQHVRRHQHVDVVEELPATGAASVIRSHGGRRRFRGAD
jgi:hypothetical protein